MSSERFSSKDESGPIFLPTSRRTLIKQAGGLVAAGGLANFIAACGGGGSSTATTSTGGGAAASSDVGKQLAAFYQLPSDAKARLAGESIKVGCQAILSGPIASTGAVQLNGIKLAIQHIAAAGGPKLDLQLRDGGSANAQKSAGVARELGLAGVPVYMTTASAGAGGEIPFYKQFKMFAVDSGGAVAALQGVPYYYMARSLVPDQQVGGLMQWVKAEHGSDVKTVSYYAYDVGPQNASWFKAVSGAVQSAGYKMAGPTVLVDPTSTDLTSSISKLKAQNGDVVINGMAGDQLGLSLKAMAAAGISPKQMTGLEYLNSLGKTAGSALNNFVFALDLWNGKSDLVALFTKEYQAAHGEAPSYSSANFYQATWMLYDLMRRVAAAGQDVHAQGDNYVNAFNSKPSFVSLFGGSGSTIGTDQFDTAKHSLTSRAMGVSRIKAPDAPIELLATFNVNGQDYAAV